MNHLTVSNGMVFTRQTTAYMPGQVFAAGQPRYHNGGLLIEGPTVNVLAQNLYTARGYSTAIQPPYANHGYGWMYTLAEPVQIIGEIGPLELLPNTDYTLSFRAAASQAITLLVDLYPDTLPDGPGFPVDDTPRDFEWSFNSGPSGDLASCHLRFYNHIAYPAGLTIAIADVQLEAKPYATSWHIDYRAAEMITLPMDISSQAGSMEFRLIIPGGSRDIDLFAGTTWQGRIWLPFAMAGEPQIKFYTSERGELNYDLPTEVLGTEIVLAVTWDAIAGHRRIFLNGEMVAEDLMNATEIFYPGSLTPVICANLNGIIFEARFSSISRSPAFLSAAVGEAFWLDDDTVALFVVTDGAGALTCYPAETISLPNPQYPGHRAELNMEVSGYDSAGGYYAYRRGAMDIVEHSPQFIMTGDKYIALDSFVRERLRGIRYPFVWIDQNLIGRSVRLSSPELNPEPAGNGLVRVGIGLTGRVMR